MIKKTNASKLTQADYVYILQLKADHQVSKIPFTDFQWIGPYNKEEAQPGSNYLIRKFRTDKTQVLQLMRLPHFTPRQFILDIQIKPGEGKPDLEVINKHNCLYAKAWECDYEKPIFDSVYKNAVTPNSPGITVQCELAANETSIIPGTLRESFPEFFF